MVAVLVVLCVIPAAAQARAKLPLLPTDASTRHNLQVRPFVIDFTGDGSGWLGGFDGSGRYPHWGHLHWSQWSSTQATGHGAVWIDDCQPDCAAGTFPAYPVTIYANRVRANVFRRLTLDYRYNGKRVIDRRSVYESTFNGRHSFHY